MRPVFGWQSSRIVAAGVSILAISLEGHDVTLTKPAGTWTYEDLFALPDDGRRYEIIEGALYEMPSPGAAHAITIIRLIAALLPIVAKLKAELLAAPLDVFARGANPVQPHLLVILPGGPARIVPRGVEGPPDLVVEVISPFNREHDVRRKRALYARAGVREYRLVDPAEGTLEILSLAGGAFQSAGVASGQERPVSPLLGPLPVAVADLFAGIEA
jgi:Uma2 family endonuclease